MRNENISVHCRAGLPGIYRSTKPPSREGSMLRGCYLLCAKRRSKIRIRILDIIYISLCLPREPRRSIRKVTKCLPAGWGGRERKTSRREMSQCTYFFLCSFDLGTRQLPAVKKTRQEGIGGRKASLVSDSWAVSRAPPAACHGPCHLPSPR